MHKTGLVITSECEELAAVFQKQMVYSSNEHESNAVIAASGRADAFSLPKC